MANIGSLIGVLYLQDEFTRTLARAVTNLGLAGNRMVMVGREMTEVGRVLTASVTLPILAVSGFAVKMAADFESSFTGIKKTVRDITDEFGNLNQAGLDLQAGMRGLAKRIPVDVDDLNKVGQTAGQLHIATENILAFTEVMEKMGVSTDLEANKAAMALAQLAGITQMPQTQFENLGSTIVALGNNFRTTESKIVDMAMRIAGTGHQIGMSQGEIVAFAAAMSSVGIRAEMGGSAISQFMNRVALAVVKGGKQLNNFAAVAGMSAEQFKKLFSEDPAQAIDKFVLGLDRVKQSGGSVLLVLDQLGIKQIRMRDTLARLAGSGSELTRALQMQEVAWREGTALTREAEQRYKTFNSQMVMVWNRVKDVGIELGTALLPAIRDLVDSLDPTIKLLASMAKQFASLPEPIRKMLVVMAALAAATGPAVFVVGTLVTALGTLSGMGPAIVTGMGAIRLSVVGVGAVAIAAAIAIGALIQKWKDALDAANQYNIATGNLEGHALEFIRTVKSSGGVVSKSIFTEAMKDAGELQVKVKNAREEVASLIKAQAQKNPNNKFREGSPLGETFNSTELKDAQDNLHSLEAAYSRLIPALEKVKVTADKATKSLNPDPKNRPYGVPPDPLAGLHLDTSPPDKAFMTKAKIREFENLNEAMGKQIAGLKGVISAYGDGVVAGNRMADSTQAQADALAKADQFSGKYAVTIYDTSLSLHEFQKAAEVAARVADFSVSVGDVLALSVSYNQVGTSAAKMTTNIAKARRELALEVAIRQAVGDAIGFQAARLSALAAIKFQEDEIQRNKDNLLAIQVENKDLDDLIATYGQGIAAVNSMTDELSTLADIRDKTNGLEETAAANMEAEIRRRARLRREVEQLNIIGSVFSQASLAVATSNISVSDSHLRAIETQYLSFLQTLGRGSIEEGKKVVDALSSQWVDFGEVIKMAIGLSIDSRALDDIRQAGKSPFDVYREERANIERILQESTDKTVEITRGGAILIQNAVNQLWSSQIGNWTGVLHDLSDSFGGVFTALSQGMDIIAKAQNTYASISKAVTSAGGSADWGNTFGQIGAWLQIFKGIYDVWSSHNASARARKYEEAAVVTMSSGTWNQGQMATGGQGPVQGLGEGLSRQIKKTAEAFAEAIGGTISTFADLEIQVRRDGKYFKAFVGHELIGQFESIEQATQAALAAAFSDPKTTFRGLTELVKQALGQIQGGIGLGDDASAMQDWLVQIREVAELRWSDDAKKVGEFNRRLDGLWRSLAEVSDATPAVSQGFLDIAQSEIDSWQAWSDSISGRQKTDAEIAADQERERQMFIAQKALRMADLEMRLIELKQYGQGVVTRGRIDQAGGNIDNALDRGRWTRLGAMSTLAESELNLNAAVIRSGSEFVSARAGLVQAELSLTQQYSDAVAAQIAAIEAILAGLAAIPDPVVGPVGGRGGTGGTDAQARADARRGLRDEAAMFGATDLQRTLFEAGTWLRDFKEKIKDAGLTAKESARLTAEATAEAERRRQEAIRQARAASITPFLGPPAAAARSPFAQQLADITLEYENLRRTHVATGIALWQINQAERERGRLLGQEARISIGIFSARLAQDLDTTASSLNFLRENAARLGMTAEQVAADIAEVSRTRFIDLAEAMANQLKDEKLLAELAEMKYDIQKANWRMEIEMAHERGILLDAEYRRLLEILGRLPDNLPVVPPDDQTNINEIMARRIEEAAQMLADAAKKFNDSTQRLIDGYNAMQLSNLSILDPQEMQAEAERQYQEVLAKARSGDIDARNGFNQVAQSLLQVGRDNFSSSQPYTDLYDRVMQDWRGLINAPYGGILQDNNVIYGAFARASIPLVEGLAEDGPIARRLDFTSPVVLTVKDEGDRTVNATNTMHTGLRDQLAEIKTALTDQHSTEVLEGKLSRVADALESFLRRTG